jgi:transposase-like protein
VLTELKNRGVADVCMVVCDGLKGLPEAIEQTWPQAVTQTYVIHLLRASFRYAGRQHWDAIAKALKPVYTAPTEAAAKERFAEFAAARGRQVPGHRAAVAAGVGGVRAVPGLRRRDPQGRV